MAGGVGSSIAHRRRYVAAGRRDSPESRGFSRSESASQNGYQRTQTVADGRSPDLLRREREELHGRLEYLGSITQQTRKELLIQAGVFQVKFSVA